MRMRRLQLMSRRRHPWAGLMTGVLVVAFILLGACTEAFVSTGFASRRVATPSRSNLLLLATTQEDLAKLRVADLKDECRKHGLLVGGTKAVLIQRLLDNTDDNDVALVDDDEPSVEESATTATDPVTETDLAKLKVAELKAQCRERGLKVGGTKAVLIQRLIDHDKSNDDTAISTEQETQVKESVAEPTMVEEEEELLQEQPKPKPTKPRPKQQAKKTEETTTTESKESPETKVAPTFFYAAKVSPQEQELEDALAAKEEEQTDPVRKAKRSSAPIVDEEKKAKVANFFGGVFGLVGELTAAAVSKGTEVALEQIEQSKKEMDLNQVRNQLRQAEQERQLQERLKEQQEQQEQKRREAQLRAEELEKKKKEWQQKEEALRRQVEAERQKRQAKQEAERRKRQEQMEAEAIALAKQEMEAQAALAAKQEAERRNKQEQIVEAEASALAKQEMEAQQAALVAKQEAERRKKQEQMEAEASAIAKQEMEAQSALAAKQEAERRKKQEQMEAEASALAKQEMEAQAALAAKEEAERQKKQEEASALAKQEKDAQVKAAQLAQEGKPDSKPKVSDTRLDFYASKLSSQEQELQDVDAVLASKEEKTDPVMEDKQSSSTMGDEEKKAKLANFVGGVFGLVGELTAAAVSKGTEVALEQLEQSKKEMDLDQERKEQERRQRQAEQERQLQERLQEQQKQLKEQQEQNRREAQLRVQELEIQKQKRLQKEEAIRRQAEAERQKRQASQEAERRKKQEQMEAEAIALAKQEMEAQAALKASANDGPEAKEVTQVQPKQDSLEVASNAIPTGENEVLEKAAQDSPGRKPATAFNPLSALFAFQNKKPDARPSSEEATKGKKGESKVEATALDTTKGAGSGSGSDSTSSSKAQPEVERKQRSEEQEAKMKKNVKLLEEEAIATATKEWEALAAQAAAKRTALEEKVAPSPFEKLEDAAGDKMTDAKMETKEKVSKSSPSQTRPIRPFSGWFQIKPVEAKGSAEQGKVEITTSDSPAENGKATDRIMNPSFSSPKARREQKRNQKAGEDASLDQKSSATSFNPLSAFFSFQETPDASPSPGEAKQVQVDDKDEIPASNMTKEDLTGQDALDATSSSTPDEIEEIKTPSPAMSKAEDSEVSAEIAPKEEKSSKPTKPFNPFSAWIGKPATAKPFNEGSTSAAVAGREKIGIAIPVSEGEGKIANPSFSSPKAQREEERKRRRQEQEAAMKKRQSQLEEEAIAAAKKEREMQAAQAARLRAIEESAMPNETKKQEEGEEDETAEDADVTEEQNEETAKKTTTTSSKSTNPFQAFFPSTRW